MASKTRFHRPLRALFTRHSTSSPQRERLFDISGQSTADFATSASKASPAPSPATSTQVRPRGAYYDSLLSTPSPYPQTKAETPPTTASVPPASTASPTSPAQPTPPPDADSRPKIIFGSRLAGPVERAERAASIRARSKNIAGVLVPPKPEEPDNCCMSGCVNCVWDLYREEMETWATQMRRAERAKAAAAAAEASEKAKEDGLEVVRRGGDDVSTTAGTPMSMDDDGGGSETNWDLPALATANGEQAPVAKDLWDEQLYKNVPVGIREFMKTEKMLKLKHLREGTTGR